MLIGLPLTTTMVSGSGADEPLYMPEIKRGQPTVGDGGKPYIGDGKMGALATRAWMARSGDYSVCPLAGKQMPAEALDKVLLPVFNGTQALEPIYQPEVAKSKLPQRIADGYEVSIDLEATVAGQPVAWQERRLGVRSVAPAARQAEHLDQQLQQAMAEIHQLNKRKQGKKILDAEALKVAAHPLLERRRVAGLISMEIKTTTQSLPKRKYGTRPAKIIVESHSTITAQIETLAVEATQQRLGWRVYATHHGQMTRVEVVMAYREQYRIERGFGRFKGHPLSLTPLFLQPESRGEGLIHLLSLALWVLVMVEFVVRRQLANTHSQVAGLYR